MKKAGVAEGEEKQRLSEGHLKRWENSGAAQNRYCRKKASGLISLCVLEKDRILEEPTVSPVGRPIPRRAGT